VIGRGPDVTFTVDEASVVPFAAVPMVAFLLKAKASTPEQQIHSIALRCQIQIEAPRREYSAEERARLIDLFGEPDRWSQTLRGLLWTHASAVVPRFTGGTEIELQVPCTFDFNVGATKYFYGVSGGHVPLCFLFSGTVFYEGENGVLQVAPISWEKEARFRLPQDVWRSLIDTYYPNSAWLVLRRDVFDRLYQLKLRDGIPTWDETIERVLATAGERVSS
jgi:hypothetical protein